MSVRPINSLASMSFLATILTCGVCMAGAVAPTAKAPEGAFPFAEYDALLKKYVDDQGRVDYDALKAKDRETVEKLYASIAATGPTKTPDLYKGKNAAFAYYLDAYNLIVWKNVIDRLPKLKQVNESLYAFFRNPDFMVDGKEVNLDKLEKKVIAERFKDGRIHFALNCASGGCPKLPRDAFTPEKVQSQLDRQAKIFCNEKRNVNYDPAAKKVVLSMIFKWYKEQFNGGDVIGFINKYRAPDAQLPADVKIDHVEYDWRMNNKSLPDR